MVTSSSIAADAAGPQTQGFFQEELDPDSQDLILICAGEELVSVNSALLSRATFSPAINEMIATLKRDHPLGSPTMPMKLPLREDQGSVWSVVCQIIAHPVAPAGLQGLTWANIQEVVKLADKYQLCHVLQAVQAFIFSEVANQPVNSRPHITARYDCNEHDVEKLLHLQELLVHAGMPEAMQAVARFHVAYLQSLCTSTGTSKVRSSESIWYVRWKFKPHLHSTSSKAPPSCGLSAEVQLQVYTIIRMLRAGLSAYTRNTVDREAAFQVLRVTSNDLATITEQVAKALMQ